MAHSAAAEMVKWTRNREADIQHAHLSRQLVRMAETKRDRAIYLNILHKAVNCVRIDVRMIAFEAAELSLCADHEFERDCTCVAPF